MQCPKCKTEILATAKFCPECGKKVEPQGKTCPNKACKRTGLPHEAMYCPDCGTKLTGGFSSFTETVNGVSFDMVAIEGGSFMMGSNEEEYEKPIHVVTVSDFYLEKTPVTVGQFKSFVESTGYRTTAEMTWGSKIIIYKEDFDCDFLWGEDVNWQCGAGGDIRNEKEFDYPVIHISWDDAIAYCNWLNEESNRLYRLPTEAEWEFAAGGGLESREKFAGTNNKRMVENYSWTSQNSRFMINPVARLRPNKLGLYDMSGNINEWCNDWYALDYYSNSPSINPQGPENAFVCDWRNNKIEQSGAKVIRGGAYNFRNEDCRVSKRYHEEFENTSWDIGFRIALTSIK